MTTRQRVEKWLSRIYDLERVQEVVICYRASMAATIVYVDGIEHIIPDLELYT